MSTSVVNIKNNEDYDVYIGRPSKWGNPFVIGIHGSRIEVIQKYLNWILEQPLLLSSLQELKSQRLGCYCSPTLCHGNVLAKLADIPIGPVLFKSEWIDIVGISGADTDNNILLRTVYGDKVKLNEVYPGYSIGL